MRLRHALLMTAILSACPRTQLKPVVVDFVVAPAQLEFGDVRLTAHRALAISVINRANTRAEVTITSAEPFDAPTTLSLQPGEQAPVTVTFAPRAVGRFDATLVLTAEALTQTVALTGVGLDAEVCAAPPPCWSAAVVDGLCQTSKQPDGTACVDTCLESAECRDGTCIGAAKQCPDDGDACTVETCQAAVGCRSVARVCGEASDRCHAPRCDRQLGCVQDTVIDGTACGPADCNTALVCLRGDCVVRAVADGTSCNTGMVCHTQGQCQAGACTGSVDVVVQPSHQLSNAWHLGASDERGTTFVVRGTDGGSALAAIEPDGGVRFHVTLPSWPDPSAFDSRFTQTQPLLSLFAADTLVVAQSPFAAPDAGPAVITAVNTLDGGVRWSRVVDDALGVVCNSAFGSPSVARLALDGTGALLVLAGVRYCPGARVTAFNLTTGNAVWSTEVNAGHGLVGGAAGGAWVSDGTVLTHLNTQGLADWTMQMPGVLQAVQGGTAWFRSRYEVTWRPLDGGVFNQRYASVYEFDELSDTYQPWSGGHQPMMWVAPRQTTPFIWALDDGTRSTAFQNDSHPMSGVWGYALEGGRSLVLTSSTRTNTFFLIAADGGVDEQCEYLPPGFPLRASAAVSSGRFVVSASGTVGVFDVPGLEPRAGTRWSQPSRNAQRWNQESP